MSAETLFTRVSPRDADDASCLPPDRREGRWQRRSAVLSQQPRRPGDPASVVGARGRATVSDSCISPLQGQEVAPRSIGVSLCKDAQMTEAFGGHVDFGEEPEVPRCPVR